MTIRYLFLATGMIGGWVALAAFDGFSTLLSAVAILFAAATFIHLISSLFSFQATRKWLLIFIAPVAIVSWIAVAATPQPQRPAAVGGAIFAIAIVFWLAVAYAIIERVFEWLAPKIS